METLDEISIRRDRLKILHDLKINPYPSQSARTHDIAEILAKFNDFVSGQEVCLAGRIMARRSHGGSTFLDLYDGSGKIQVYIKRDEVGEEAYKNLEYLDVGDFVEAIGGAFQTKKGEKSVLAKEALKLLTKTLRPLPEKWHGLNDIEIRYRKRYLDLLVNEPVKLTTLARTEIIKFIRNYFNEAGFIEVETPILQVLPGGATARPFKTHHNVLDMDLYLRVAPELYLKRLLIAGLPRVYEIAKCFRNEGIDHAHNPEFTQIELYEAYADYESLMKRLETFLSSLVLKVHGSLDVRVGKQTLDFTPPYPRLDWSDTLDQAMGEKISEIDDDHLRTKLAQNGIEVLPHEGRGAMLDGAFKKLVRPKIIQPTFLIDHPIELSPLAKKHRTKPDRVERFQLVLAEGVELMNGFSELNDPIDQRSRFEYQEKLRLAGDEEAHRIDNDFLEALEYGMPPAAGVGIGVDRLVAILTNNHNLKEVILFPTLRPK